MEFIDLKKQYKQLEKNINSAITNVLKHGRYIKGPEVKLLENELSSYCNVNSCITVANGTDALEIALKAIDILPNDEVMVPSYTWVSTAEVVKYLGATPVYCDVKESTFNIDIDDVKKKITSRTRAIIAVSLFGQCAELLKLKEICDQNNITLIEDAAQSFGASHHRTKSCGIAHISTTSFFPSKPLGCYGDGGAIFTNDGDLSSKMRLIANHGQEGKDNFTLIGRNSRLDSIQAAILLVKLGVLDEEIRLRNEIHSFYSNNINPSIAETPKIESYNESVFAQYTLKSDKKTIRSLKEVFNAKEIPFMNYYERPIYIQSAYKSSDECLPITDNLSTSTISIPMSPYLKNDDLEKIVDSINGVGD